MSVTYIMKESFSGFQRAKLAAIGSIITITLSLLLLGLFYVISSNTSRIVDRILERVEMEAFLDEPLSRQKMTDIQQALTEIEGIERVQFVSKDDAARTFKEEFGEDINKVLEFNPLPPSYKIFLQDGFRTAAHADEIQKKASSIPGVANVIFRKDMLEFIEKQARTLYAVGLTLGILIGISAVFLVSNTIRLTIVAKRQSVKTMKLVGASRWFVRAPFLIEGLFQGMLGGIIASAIIFYLVTFATGLISQELAEFIRLPKLFYVSVIILGSVLGLFGSTISIRKYIGETVTS